MKRALLVLALHGMTLARRASREDDDACALSSLRARERRCWERISALDVERCRDAGECP